MRSALLLGLAVLTALACGPSGPAGRIDGGPGDGGVDASRYDPVLGNPFDGLVELDDARVEAVDPSALAAGSPACRAPVLARVTRVIDGDTVFVNGESEALSIRVRMIGVDTPELNEATTMIPDCYGEQALGFTEQLQSRLVWLTFDQECMDSFDRLLAYVWIGGGPQDLWERQLLRRGYARVLTIRPNDAFERELDQDEFVAVGASAGLWGACP